MVSNPESERASNFDKAEWPGHLESCSTEFDRGRVGGRAGATRQAAITFAATAARLRGYRAAVEAAGLRWSRVPVFEAVENSEAQGYLAARKLLTAKVRPTAILAMTDQLALGALEAAGKHGLVVPRDLSVVGFDDIPAAARQSPPLTTVHQPHQEKGRRAAERLLSLLSGETDGPQIQTLPTELQVRQTSAPPKRGRHA
jgi:DNA-binding LacI/PurR family transcriptional regulator